MTQTKLHHHIPQWLIRCWANEDDQVNAIDRRNPNVVRAFTPNVRSINAVNHLYSYLRDDGTKNDELETGLYSPMDGAACKLTSQIVAVLQKGSQPKPDYGARKLLWQFFFYNAFKRRPGALDKYVDGLDYNEVREEAISTIIAEGGDPDQARTDIESYDLKADLMERGKQYARAEQSEAVLNHFAQMGIIFGVAPPKKSFVLPDRAFTVGKRYLNTRSSIWIPIHPDYAISPVINDAGIRLEYFDQRKVRILNERWYGLSKVVVSKSQQQLVSLVKRHDRKKIVFDLCAD